MLDQRTAHKEGRVTPGTTVELTALGEDKILTFTVVRTAQANPAQGKISDASPMGEAVIGRRAGDEVVALTPRGERRYRIADVRR